MIAASAASLIHWLHHADGINSDGTTGYGTNGLVEHQMQSHLQSLFRGRLSLCGAMLRVIELLTRRSGLCGFGGHLGHRRGVLLAHRHHGLLGRLRPALQAADVSVQGLYRLLQRPAVGLVLLLLHMRSSQLRYCFDTTVLTSLC